MTIRFPSLIALPLLCAISTSCKLVLMPVRVAAGVADGVYETGKGAVDASSEAMDRRKARKEKEKQEAAKKEAQAKKAADAEKLKQEGGGLLPPPDSIPTQEPAIPLDGPAVEPEPLPLPQ